MSCPPQYERIIIFSTASQEIRAESQHPHNRRHLSYPETKEMLPPMTNMQLYLAIGIPILSNAALIGLLLAYINAKFDGVNAKFDSINAKFDAKFDGVNAKFDSVNAKFDSVNKR